MSDHRSRGGYGAHNGGEQRYKRREVEKCACGVTLYLEECTRGPRAGEMVPRTEKGAEHRCRMQRGPKAGV